MMTKEMRDGNDDYDNDDYSNEHRPRLLWAVYWPPSFIYNVLCVLPERAKRDDCDFYVSRWNFLLVLVVAVDDAAGAMKIQMCE